MATYKVLQDIEAEDKLLGPLTLRQFIYGLATAFMGWLTFLVISKGASFLAPMFLMPALLFGFFAFPWGRDQPTEVWALAKVRFLVKPRKRIWNQDGLKELVTITVPKHVVQVYTNGLSQNEVKSRLEALASTIDSRGWAIKNAPAGYQNNSDRLINPMSLPRQVPTIDDRTARDMLDEQDNPVAEQFNTMINAASKARRQRAIDQMQNPLSAPVAPQPTTQQAQGAPQAAQNFWFLNQPQQQTSSIPQDYVTFNTQVVEPGAVETAQPQVAVAAMPTAEEEAFLKSHQPQPLFSAGYKEHMRVVEPLADKQKRLAAEAEQAAIEQQAANQAAMDAARIAQQQAMQNATATVTQQPDAAILDLVRNNDLDVATIAREAQKRKNNPPDEVVISLH